MEKKDFDTAFKVACLGVTEADWRSLALDALQSLRFQISRKAFIRIRDVRYIDLLNRIIEQHCPQGGKQQQQLTSEDEQLISAQVLAFQGKYHEAAQIYARLKAYNLIVEMYTDLRKWDDAKHWAQQSEKAGIKPSGVAIGDTNSVAETGGSRTQGGPGATGAVATAGGGSAGGSVAQGLILKQAASSEEDGDLRSAGEMYLTAGQHKKAA